MMRFFLVALAALLVFGGVVAVPSSASAEAHWRHYGADHAYASKEAAMADAPNVFRRAGWPPEAVTAMVEQMRTVPAERITLKKGDRLDFMRTGPSGLWRDVVVDFQSPRGMLITAPADRWVVTVDGVTYEAIRPDVCNNLGGRSSDVPDSPCAYLVFFAKDKDAYGRVAALGEVTSQEEAECPISYQGVGTGADGRTFDPNGYKPLVDCPDHPCDWRQASRFYGLPLHRQGSFAVSEGWWVVRLPRRFAETMDLRAVLCLTDDNGQNTHMMGALPELYVQAPGGMEVYTLYYDEAQIPVSYQALYQRENAESARWRWVNESRQQYAAFQ